jgi:hypothetical protein
MTLQEKLRNPTLGENRDDGGGVGHNRVVAVVLHLAAVDLEAAGENGVGNSAGVSELGWQAASLRIPPSRCGPREKEVTLPG